MINKTISCGGIIINSNKEFLICQPSNTMTGNNDKCWNLPKGGMKREESLYQTTYREIYEECGMKLFEDIDGRPTHYPKETALGIFKYNRYKYLFLIALELKEDVSIDFFNCNIHNGDKYPEMSDFKWVTFNSYKDYVSEHMRCTLFNVEIVLKEKGII